MTIAFRCCQQDIGRTHEEIEYFSMTRTGLKNLPPDITNNSITIQLDSGFAWLKALTWQDEIYNYQLQNYIEFIGLNKNLKTKSPIS